MFKGKCNCQYEQGHSIACPLYKERAFKVKPSWEEDFNEIALDSNGDIHMGGSRLIKLKDFIRQTIKTEREQAVKEAYQSSEFTDVIEMEKKKAIKEERKRIAYRISKIGKNEVVDELLRINGKYYELKAKYDKA